jgi:ankyrin repeat protein
MSWEPTDPENDEELRRLISADNIDWEALARHMKRKSHDFQTLKYLLEEKNAPASYASVAFESIGRSGRANADFMEAVDLFQMPFDHFKALVNNVCEPIYSRKDEHGTYHEHLLFGTGSYATTKDYWQKLKYFVDYFVGYHYDHSCVPFPFLHRLVYLLSRKYFFSCHELPNLLEETMLAVFKLMASHVPEEFHLQDQNRKTPLHLFARWGKSRRPNKDVVKMIARYLLEKYPDSASLLDSDFKSPLEIAIRDSNLGVIEALFDHNPKLAATPFANGTLPLHYAIIEQDDATEAIKLIMDKSPNCLEDENHHGMLSLHIAVWHGKHCTIRFILEAFPEAASLRDMRGDLPLHTICNAAYGLRLLSRVAAKCLDLLLHSYPQAARTRDKDGNLPLHLLCDTTANDAFGGTHTQRKLVMALVRAAPDTLQVTNGDKLLPFQLSPCANLESLTLTTSMLPGPA